MSILQITDKIFSLIYVVPVNVSYRDLKNVPDYIEDAIPFFILMIALEQFYVHYYRTKNAHIYTLKDLIFSVSLGILQQLVMIWFKVFLYIPYQYVYDSTALLREKNYSPILPYLSADQYPVLLFLGGFLGCDLVYYIFHRCSHEFHCLWFTHSVHHTGERYNLATALRQGAVQPLFSWMFYLPLAVLGLPVTHYFRHMSLNTVYQFWVHTEIIGRLPIAIELILNTPSHHRMHHRPPGNCNYAGVLIIWDRIFGTFESELALRAVSNPTLEPPSDPPATGPLQPNEFHRAMIFGLARPMPILNPLFANVSHLLRLSEVAFRNVANGKVQGIQYYVTLTQEFFSALVKKRVKHPLTINLTWEKLAPDIIQQGRLYSDLKSFWKQLTFLPPSVTVAAVNEELEKDPTAEALFSPKEKKFFVGRLKREKKFKNSTWASLVFGVTLAYSFALLLVHERAFLEGSSVEKAGYIASVVGCVFALQYLGNLE